MARIPEDPTIFVGLRLYDGTSYDTVVERVEYGGFGVIAFGSNQLDNGMMTVYKTLRRELLKEPQTRASFVRECLLWCGLWRHPNVAVATSVIEMGDAEGLRPFLALEYAEHGSLRNLLLRAAQREANRRLPLSMALNLAQQITAGLAYLHQPDPTYLRNEPIVHRDLKPENVLLMGDGRAAITDFGLAKAVEASPTAIALLLSHYGPAQSGQQVEEAILVGSEQATQTTSLHTRGGMALGTLAYMPPEQWDDARYAGPPADIYALGVMFSELFAGRHALLDLSQPHSQDDWRRAHGDPHPRRLREVAPDAPDVIEALYQRCLARAPEDRPTAAEALAVLQAGARLSGQTVYVPPEYLSHTPANEKMHWHNWSIAYLNFDLFDEALERSDRALVIARRIASERPDLLASSLLTRGNILKELGARALDQGNTAEAARIDQQVEDAFQECLGACPPASTADGRRIRAVVWKQIGVFNKQRKRFVYADDAYARALTLQPDMPDTYYNRALNQAQWGTEEARSGRLDAAIAHLRQARVYAITSLGMNDPTAQRLIQAIEATLRQYGVTE